MVASYDCWVEGEGKVLLGEMSRPKKKQSEGQTELQYNDEVQGVQRQDEVEHLALFGGKGEQGVALPH
jgi:hypothetical protein